MYGTSATKSVDGIWFNSDNELLISCALYSKKEIIYLISLYFMILQLVSPNECLTWFTTAICSGLKYLANSRQKRVRPSDLNWLARTGSCGLNDDLQLFKRPVLFIITNPSTQSNVLSPDINFSWSLVNVAKSVYNTLIHFTCSISREISHI